MVLPKMGASYVIKKFADEIMAEPKAAVESAMSAALDPNASVQQPPSTKTSQPASGNQRTPDEWDGQPISNEDGELIGTARRVHQVGLYIISDTYGDLAKELESCVLDDESRRFFVYDAQGQVAGLIYAPHPDKMPVRAEAIRADDI